MATQLPPKRGVHKKSYSQDWVISVRDETTGATHEYVTAEYIAKRKHISTSTVALHVRNGNLNPVDFMGRLTVFRLDEAKAFIEKKFSPGVKPKVTA